MFFILGFSIHNTVQTYQDVNQGEFIGMWSVMIIKKIERSKGQYIHHKSPLDGIPITVVSKQTSAIFEN